jgi:hypothetical protein
MRALGGVREMQCVVEGWRNEQPGVAALEVAAADAAAFELWYSLSQMPADLRQSSSVRWLPPRPLELDSTPATRVARTALDALLARRERVISAALVGLRTAREPAAACGPECVREQIGTLIVLRAERVGGGVLAFARRVGKDSLAEVEPFLLESLVFVGPEILPDLHEELVWNANVRGGSLDLASEAGRRVFGDDVFACIADGWAN